MKRGHIPVRTCRGCGKKTSRDKLLRYVMQSGSLEQKKQDGGYGFYCCPDKDCRDRIQQKLKKQKLVKADKRRGRE